MNKGKFDKRLALLWLLLPTWAMAHSSSDSLGAMSGFYHPFQGLDHLLAMLSVGIVSAQIGGRSIWTIPALFVTSMVIGGIIGLNHPDVPYVEMGVSLSVVALGLAIVFVEGRRNLMLVMCFVAFFGALHGHAHGVEAPKAASPFYYSFGFVVSTSVIHLIGVFVGWCITEQQRLKKASAFLGAAISFAGLYFIKSLM